MKAKLGARPPLYLERRLDAGPDLSGHWPAGPGDRRCLEEIVTRRKTKLGSDHAETLLAESQLVRAYLDARRWADAEVAARECLEISSRTQPDGWLRFHTMSQLGAALAGLKQYPEAEPLLIGGYEGLRARERGIPASSRKILAVAAGPDRNVIRSLGQGGSGDGVEGEARPGRPARRRLRPALNGASASTEPECSHRPSYTHEYAIMCMRQLIGYIQFDERGMKPGRRSQPGLAFATVVILLPFF